MLRPGGYLLSFDLRGNSSLLVPGVNQLTVTLGPDGSGSLYDVPFTLPGNQNTPAVTETVTNHLITVSTPESAELIFRSANTGFGINGTIIDNIVLRGVPEPATLGLMVLGLLGGAGFAGRKRRN